LRKADAEALGAGRAVTTRAAHHEDGPRRASLPTPGKVDRRCGPEEGKRGRTNQTRRAFVTSALIGFAAPAIIPAHQLMRIRGVPELQRPSAGFALRIFLNSRAKAIGELEHAGCDDERIAAELDRRGMADMNGRAWTPARLREVAASARRLRLPMLEPRISARFSTTEGRPWTG